MKHLGFIQWKKSTRTQDSWLEMKISGKFPSKIVSHYLKNLYKIPTTQKQFLSKITVSIFKTNENFENLKIIKNLVTDNFSHMLMEINLEAHSTRELLCEICTEPCSALIFAAMIQEVPIVGRPGFSAPLVRVEFNCFSTMGYISFTSDRTITRR